MGFAAGFACLLALFLILGDWYQFTRLHPFSARYGCRIAQRHDYLPSLSLASLHRCFDSQGILYLPHGIARWIHDQRLIMFRPSYQLYSLRFRTAWPLKGTIEVSSVEDQTLCLRLTKRLPWSSAILSLTWLGLVAGGTLTFVILFARDGGFSTLGGILLGCGVAAGGVLVLAFGLILLSVAYRLEDHRLMQVYQELHEALRAHSALRNQPAPTDLRVSSESRQP
ncbi:MAG: hypothetical protein D6704_12955 [Nitrospirae bacterium]|nr:MAG: hypothetical protein D6704_12955 [Nitrospirota bacterium]